MLGKSVFKFITIIIFNKRHYMLSQYVSIQLDFTNYEISIRYIGMMAHAQIICILYYKK